MTLQRLFRLQSVLTFATFMVLVISPTTIPASLGIQLKADHYFLSYSIAAAELAIAYLSLAGSHLHDDQSLRLIARFFLVFHATIGVFALYTVGQGGSGSLMGNAIFRFVIAAVFYYYGIVRQRFSDHTPTR